ncbi:MAG: D-glycero-beta-D-manno-heptose-7-phosphate kinase [Crocinitomicaceae bacterium]|nr:D-glycero-beta-D-manno-heptose-7-phosphate kinase [Crocinitomicaceae bacterium]
MDVKSIFDQFAQKRILVLGDVMIDAYMTGNVSRVSPEAPVPIVNLAKSEERLGGAANVALNLLALGAEPILCTLIGDDDGSRTFFELMDKRGMSTAGILKSADRKTTRKTRVIGNNQHLLRIDEEIISPLNAEQENDVIARAKGLIEAGVDAIIIEDYNKGLLTKYVIQSVIQIANDNNVIITVDPKKDNFFAYENVTLFKPNLKELKEGVNMEFDLESDQPGFEKAIARMEAKLNNKISLVTLSKNGVFIKSQEQKAYIPAHLRRISDVSGAGDTVISVATLCLTAGLELQEVAEIANLSGGLVCEISGVVPVNKEQLMHEVFKLIEG